MIRILTLLFALFPLFMSCSLSSEYYSVQLEFLERSPWEHAIKTPGWYRVCYLTGTDEVSQLYVSSSSSSVTLLVPKGEPLVAAAYPFGEYAPLGGVARAEELKRKEGKENWYIGLSSRVGPTADALLRYRSEFSELLPSLSLQQLADDIWEQTDGKPWLADWGELYMELNFGSKKSPPIETARQYTAQIDFSHGGWWICDHRGVEPFSLPQGGAVKEFTLPAGTYAFYNPAHGTSLQVLSVMENGTASVETVLPPSPLR
ncbi:MAG: hypothetical protein ACQEQU_06975 [Spirochaetota bacterium]